MWRLMAELVTSWCLCGGGPTPMETRAIGTDQVYQNADLPRQVPRAQPAPQQDVLHCLALERASAVGAPTPSVPVTQSSVVRGLCATFLGPHKRLRAFTPEARAQPVSSHLRRPQHPSKLDGHHSYSIIS